MARPAGWVAAAHAHARARLGPPALPLAAPAAATAAPRGFDKPVYVNGKRVRTLKGKRLRAAVDLRGLPRGTFRVKVQGVTRRHAHVRDLRTHHRCVPKRASRSSARPVPSRSDSG